VQASKDTPGNSIPCAEFVLLSSLSDDHLLVVAADLSLALLPRVGSCEELLSLVRAKRSLRLLIRLKHIYNF
jgi:hypothetical protein